MSGKLLLCGGVQIEDVSSIAVQAKLAVQLVAHVLQNKWQQFDGAATETNLHTCTMSCKYLYEHFQKSYRLFVRVLLQFELKIKVQVTSRSC